MRKPPEEMTFPQRLAQSFIVKGILQGLTGAEIYRLLREEGLGYRRQEFYRDYNYWKEVVRESEEMRFIRRDAKIPEERYLESWDRRLGGYQTIVRIDVLRRDTGEKDRIFVTVVHEHFEAGELVPDTHQVYTRKEIEEKALGIIQYRIQAGELEVLNVTPVLGFKVMRNIRRGRGV
ncbi:MAG: hypothetical protein QXY94_02590 [Archaeoglobaceae archaeon]